MRKRLLISLALIIFLFPAACAPLVSNHTNMEEAQKAAGEGIVFKAPNNFMQAPMKDFKGVLFLSPEKPAVIYVTYPNDGESVEDLKNRLKNFAIGMFGNKEAEMTNLKWKSVLVPSHQGDLGDNGTLNVIENDNQTIQVSIYEKEWKSLRFIYGYFAMKDKKATEPQGIWLDEKGQGIPEFEEFWKTLPMK